MGYFSTAAKHQQTVFFRSLTNLCFRCLVNSSGVFIGKNVKLRESWSFVEGKELSIGFKTEVQWLVFKGVLDTDEDYNSNDVGSSPTYSTFVCFVPCFINVFKPFLISLVSILVTSVAREQRENERVSGRGWPMPNRCQWNEPIRYRREWTYSSCRTRENSV